MTVSEVSPGRRLLGYMLSSRGPYLVGTLLTLGYAAFFQLIPLAVRRIVAALVTVDGVPDVTGPVAWLVFVSLVFAAFRLSSRIVMFRIGRSIEYRIRNDYFEHLQRLPQSFFNAHRTGDLMSRAVNDINSIRLFLGMGLLNIIQTPILYVGAIAVMLSIDPWVTLWVLSPYPLFIVVARLFGKRMFRANVVAQEQLGHVSTAVQENASGVMVVRSYVLEDQQSERFEEQNRLLYRRQLDVGLVSTSMMTSVSILPALASGLVILAGGRAVQSGSLLQQDLWVFWVYIGMLTFPTVLLGFVISIAQRGLAALKRLGEVLDTEPSIRDRADLVDVSSIRGEVDVRGLDFSYPAVRDGGERGAALEDIWLDVEAGRIIGIVGPVGSGKSTLVSVIPRLLEVPDDRVLIDGIDVNRLPLRMLRSSIAMVPQDSFLFSTTVAGNIRFGRPDASDEEVHEAARRAHVLEDIEEFSQGFDTPVGERGITLSGGQRQRIALARALILEPSILILDDSLSSVDHATEEAILGDLRVAMKSCTAFIVAHRISAVREADQILVLEDGRITERGTHEQLIGAGGFYSRLYERQQLEEVLEGEGTEDVA